MRRAAATPDPRAFAGFVKTLGRGKTARRSLSESEAEEAFGMILDGTATATQIGAFLMLLRVKEETCAEITGMVRAARAQLHGPGGDLRVDLDWPSYAGKRQHHPWYLLSALLLADAGFRVLMHGSAPHEPDRLFAPHALRELGFHTATSWQDARHALDAHRFCYVPLEMLSPVLESLMDLRAEFGLRSPVNTLVRHLDPARARAGLRSLHHPAYAALHAESALALGNDGIAVFRGEGGECEIRPDADTAISLLLAETLKGMTLTRRLAQRNPKPERPSAAALRALWNDATACDYGLDAVLGTASVALLALGEETDMDGARHAAEQLWQRRGALPKACE